MSILPNFLRSLMLTILLSFVAPIFLFGGVLVSLCLIGYIPGIERVAQVIAEQILQFLATFGRRNPFQGLVVIALTCSFVGALFDTYAFYRYQSLRNH